MKSDEGNFKIETFVLKMHFKNVLKQILVLLWIYSTCYDGIFADVQLGDPYRILGVERKASSQEIRQAYKKLAKKWYVCQIERGFFSFLRMTYFVDYLNCFFF